MRRQYQNVLVPLLIVVLASSFLVGCGGKSAQEVKVGSIAPLTGPLSTYGQSHKNAVDLAVEQINEKGEAVFPGGGRRSPADAELARLKRENERLKEENEILIKAAKYFARESG